MGRSTKARWLAAAWMLAGCAVVWFGCRSPGRRCMSKRKLRKYCERKCRKWVGKVPQQAPRDCPPCPRPLARYRGTDVGKLLRDLKRSGWSSTIVFLDPRHANDVWMRISVKPETTACVSNDQTRLVATVPIPPDARLTACGIKAGAKRWYEHSRGVGVVEIHRGRGRRKPLFRISWKNIRGNVRVFSQTFVLPDEYEWEARDMRKVVNFAGQPVNVNWKKWRHNILSMTVPNVHHIKGRLKYRLRKTPLEEELLRAYKDCPECIKRTADGVMVRLPMQVLFGSGKARLAPAGRRLLKQFVPVLRRHVAVGRTISVVGHTDKVPIRLSGFASNWELSTARSCAVVRFFERSGLPSKYFKAVGHAGNRPVASNVTPQGRGRNRRVELFFETKSTLPAGPPKAPPAARPASPR